MSVVRELKRLMLVCLILTCQLNLTGNVLQCRSVGWGVNIDITTNIYCNLMIKDPLATLNEQQRQVAQTVDGPLLVLAGAGSGKTKALTHRIAYLLHKGMAGPGEILAVTFTNKAAGEMKERVGQLVGTKERVPHAISTFHALGARLLREMEGAHARSKRFLILDAKDSERLVRQALKDHNLSLREWNPRILKQKISTAKGSLLSAEMMGGGTQGLAEEVLAKVYKRYEELLAAHDAYDFDDLLGVPVAVLEREESLREGYRRKWQWLSVDEYQDTNPLQSRLLELLLNDKQNLCVVGDDYQAIYSWRGAEVDHILQFEQKYPQCATIYLTQNYRSTPPILQAANAVIAANTVQKHKELWTEQAKGEPVRLVALPSDRQEAGWVREALGQHLAAGGQLSEVAILYRTNAQSRLLEEEFLTHRVPYTIVGGFRFYDRREVKDALAFLHLWVNPNSRMAVDRLSDALLKRVGPKTIDRWQAAAGEAEVDLLTYLKTEGAKRPQLLKMTMAFDRVRMRPATTVAEILRQLLSESGYKEFLMEDADGGERWENVEELLNVTSAYEDVESFLEDAALLSDIDSLDDKQDRVTCMTLHAAKGLEFPVVFLVGLEEGLLPHMNSFDRQAAIEEERRLLYVGMTRARQRLILTYAQQRFAGGELVGRLASRFLDELPESVRQESSWGGMQDIEDMSVGVDDILGLVGQREEMGSGEPVLVQVAAGEFVSHRQFGRGVVIDVKRDIVTCVFERAGVKTVEAGHLVTGE